VKPVARGVEDLVWMTVSARVALNQERPGPSSSAVRHVLADFFSWEPRSPYDGIVFCFWLSHIPLEKYHASREQRPSAHRACRPLRG
jgi:hypothetical protein